jgi:flagellar hook-associated protein 3 FlgL
MGMRITNSILYRTALSDVSLQRRRLARTQEQASSGLRINRLADDPLGVRAATLLKAGIEATDQFGRNVERARVRVRASEAALAETNEVLIRVRELALQARNETNDAKALAALAEEVEHLHGQLLSAANSRAGGGYLFAGYAGDQPPFAGGPFPTGPGSPLVSFAGDPRAVRVEIDEGVQLEVTLDGRRVFLGDGDGDGNPDPGREDLFDTLGDLRDAMLTLDRAAIGSSLDRLDRAQGQIGLERAAVGAAESELERFDQRLALRSFELTKQLSEVQDADSAKVFSDLVSQENALAASLSATARIIQPTLLDFLG